MLQNDIYGWLRTLPPWRQELFLSALPGQPLDEATRDAILDALLGDPDAVATAREVRRENLPPDLAVGSTIELLSIEHVGGVNRLAAGEQLRFIARGLNVIYRFNGSGKSGWARIPKHAGRAHHEERVLGDVYAAADQRPRPAATILWRLAGGEHQLDLKLDEPAPGELAGMCVFDAQCGEQLLSSDHAVDYLPLALGAVQRFYLAHGEIAERLTQRIDGLANPELRLDDYAEGTTVRAALTDLDADTDLEALHDLAGRVDPARREELTRKITAIEARDVETLALAAERDATRAEAMAIDLTDAAERLDADALAAVAREREAVTAARDAATRLSAEQFADEPIGGAATEPWLVMWNAVKRFMHDVHGQEWPAGATHCPTCMQQLAPKARDRVALFEDFVRSEAERQLADARTALATRLDALPTIEHLRATHAAALTTISDVDEPLASGVEIWLTAAECAAAALRAGEAATPVGPPPDVTAWAKRRRAAAAEHRALQDPRTETALRGELAELRARDALAARWDDIERRVLRTREAAHLRSAEKELRTTAVANRLRAFAETFITEDLQRALEQQLRALSFDDIEVIRCSTSGRGGTPHVGLKIKAKGAAPLRAVLSDGEQRRLALAFFLAEVTVAHPGQPIVLDDPICSIDHRGRRHVARTLARAARERQVIVFTHELAFLHDLQRAAKAERLELHAQYVAKGGGRTGRVSPDLPWEGKNVKQRIGELNAMHQDLTKLHRNDPDASEYAEAAHRFCGLLRQAFERALEDEVLGGVVTRSDGGVHPQQLRDVAWSEEICDLSDRGIADNSPWVHDRARAANPPPPTPIELQEGLSILDQLRQATQALRYERRKAVKAAAQTPGKADTRHGGEGDVRQLPGMTDAA